MKEFLEKYGLGNNTDAATELATLLLREYRSGYQDAKERWQGDCTPWYATG